MIKVKSSNIAAVKHDAKTKTLIVEFISRKADVANRFYSYANVTAEQFNELLAAASHAKYLNANIKSDKHAFAKLTDEEVATLKASE